MPEPAAAAASDTRLRGANNLSAIFDQLFVGLAEVDVRGGVRSANERFCHLIERVPDTVLPGRLNVRDVLHPADRAGFERAMGRLAGGHGPFSLDVRLAVPDQRVTWVEIAAAPLPPGGGEPVSAALVVTDINRRKQAEARAGELQRRFREVADAAPVCIWTSGTDRQRRHTWVNAHWTALRGRPMEAELGSGWTSGVHPEDVGECLAAYSAAFDQHGPFTAEYRLRGGDGTYCWMLDSGTPMYDEHNRFVGYIGSSIDITARKAAEREREALLESERTARSDAERANRLKDEFLSILSHELRTPLNAVLGWVHLLRTSNPDGGLDRGLSVIERNARLQSRMVDDLLDMGGVIAGKMRLDRRRVPISRVVGAAAESLQPAFADKGVTLRRRGDADSSEVDGDPSRLHQIVWNLLSNALKFTPRGGEVTIDVHRGDSDVRIQVRDNGPGIEPKFLPYVFERFRQGDPSTRRSHGGLGIGLALVKSLAELHGGNVRADSAGAGHGSTFTVTLPLPSQSAAAPRRADAGRGTRLEGAYGS